MADFINGSFEFLAGFFILNHCWTVYRDKAVRGVSVISVIFFTAWGFWNLYYYPSLKQIWSFYGGISIVFTNILWISLILFYRRHEKNGDARRKMERQNQKNSEDIQRMVFPSCIPGDGGPWNTRLCMLCSYKDNCGHGGDGCWIIPGD